MSVSLLWTGFTYYRLHCCHECLALCCCAVVATTILCALLPSPHSDHLSHYSVPRVMKTSSVMPSSQPLPTKIWSSLMPAPSLLREGTASEGRARKTHRTTSAAAWYTWTYPTSMQCGIAWIGCRMHASPLRTTGGCH